MVLYEQFTQNHVNVSYPAGGGEMAFKSDNPKETTECTADNVSNTKRQYFPNN